MDDDSGHLLPILERPSFCIGSKNLNLFEKPCQSRGEMMNSSGKAWDEYGEDIDGGLVLDEEIEEGIDSIMGNGKTDDSDIMQLSNTCCYGYQTVGLGFDVGYGMRKELKAMRNVGEGDDWWRFPAVDLADLTQKIAEIPVEKKKKKNLESGKQNSFLASNPNKEHLGSAASCEEAFRRTCGGLLLKLNYDDVLSAWSDRGSPFSGEGPSGDDVQARLAQVDLFPEKEVGRDSNVPRYKEKRRRKMRCQVRKVKADQRLRFYEARDTLD